MSTPIKPPDGADRPDPTDDAPAAAVEGAPGEFKAELEAQAGARAAASSITSGKLEPAEAVEQLVQRALSNADGLSTAQRDALEAQLRAALRDDPTLVALQEDLRAAKP